MSIPRYVAFAIIAIDVPAAMSAAFMLGDAGSIGYRLNGDLLGPPSVADRLVDDVMHYGLGSRDLIQSDSGTVRLIDVLLTDNDPKDVTFADLHNIIQTAMGWKDEHLHEFLVESEGMRIVPADTDSDELGLKCAFEEVTPLSKYAGKRIVYTYDSFCNWTHTIRFLKEIPDYADPFLKVIKYSNRCPPEESGGAKGFLNKSEIMQDWTHPDYEYVVDWFNEDYEWYYVDDVNERLRNLERIEPGNTLGAEDIEEIMTAFINDTSADYYFDVVEKKVFRDHKGVVEDEPDRYLMVRTAKADVLDRIMREFALTRNTVKDARLLGNAMASRTKRFAKFDEAVRRLGYEREWRYVLRFTCYTIAADWANKNGFIAAKDPSSSSLPNG